MSDPATTFDIGYIEQRLSRHFDDAYDRVLIKWNEDNAAANSPNALRGSPHYIVLAQSALQVGKEALSGAFLTFLSYSRDCAAIPEDHLDVARTASDAFIARVGSKLEERALRQQSVGLRLEDTMPTVEGLKADLRAALEGNVQGAIRGPHGDQQIIVPPPSAAWEAAEEHIAARRARESAAAFAASTTPLESVSAAGAVVDITGAPPLPPAPQSISARLDGAGGFSANGVVPRQELIRLLLALPPQEEVERVFKAVAELRRHDFGGNEALAIVQKMITEVAMARDALRSELDADQPRLSVIYVTAQALGRAVAWLGDQVRWLAGKLAEGFLKAAGAALYLEHSEQIKHDAEQMLTQLVDLESKLTAIVTPIAHFFASMHLPF